MTELVKPIQIISEARRIGKKIVYQVKPILPQPTLPAQSYISSIESTDLLKANLDKSLAPGVNQPFLAAQRQKITAQILAWLTGQHPDCFNPQAKKPLKKGIHKELRALHPHLKSNGVARALKTYTHTLDYYTALLQETQRYDLEGKPCDTITEAEKIHAKNSLAELAQNSAAEIADKQE